jgi:hypothetical protein
MAESYSFAKLTNDISSTKKTIISQFPEMKNLKLMCHCEEVRRSNLLFDFQFPFSKLVFISRRNDEAICQATSNFFSLKYLFMLKFFAFFLLISPMEISLIFD